MVASLLLRIVTGCRVVTFLHNPSFDMPFIIKILGGELLERLLQNALKYGDQDKFLTHYETCQHKHKTKPREHMLSV